MDWACIHIHAHAYTCMYVHAYTVCMTFAQCVHYTLTDSSSESGSQVSTSASDEEGKEGGGERESHTGSTNSLGKEGGGSEKGGVEPAGDSGQEAPDAPVLKKVIRTLCVCVCAISSACVYLHTAFLAGFRRSINSIWKL